MRHGFRIADSQPVAGATTPVPPDVAICDDCTAELRDPNNRRYRHPFVNCTNCGPRFTIIRSLPYDRATTTMAAFEMCARLRRRIRRPGRPPLPRPAGVLPGLWAVAAVRRAHRAGRRTDDALRAARRHSAGGVLAVKGVGGYHLACDAGNDAAVPELRRRKRAATSRSR